MACLIFIVLYLLFVILEGDAAVTALSWGLHWLCFRVIWQTAQNVQKDNPSHCNAKSFTLLRRFHVLKQEQRELKVNAATVWRGLILTFSLGVTYTQSTQMSVTLGDGEGKPTTCFYMSFFYMCAISLH